MKAENETATRNERIEQKIDYCKLKNIALNKSANLEQVKLTEKVQDRAAQCIDKEILISKNCNIDIDIEIDKRVF